MRKILLMCCFLIGITAVCRAQGGGRPQMSPADRAARMKTSLALNDDQTAKITAIYTAQAKSRDSVMTAANGDRDAMRAAMGPLQTKYNAQINAILTADQQTAWKKQMDEARAQQQQRGGGGGN